MGGAACLQTAYYGGLTAWIVPIYKNGRAIWRWAENTAAPLKKAGMCEVNRAERTIYFESGGSFGIYSADSEDSIRSNAFKLVVVDEAARIAEQVWTDAIQPTLSDYNGDAILISTPKGMNWFYNEYQKALEDGHDYAAFQAPTSDNPLPNIRAAFDKITQRYLSGLVLERTYRQEWLAEFIKDGVFFTNVQVCAAVDVPDLPGEHAGHSFVMGGDWGKQNDFTVLPVACRECHKVVDWRRLSKIDYHFQREHLIDLYKKWRPDWILVESNSIGEPNIEELWRAGLPVMGFATTATSKPPLIESLALALVNGEFIVPKAARDELIAFEVETRSSGAPKYSAPEGLHDDWVIALALTWRALTMIGITDEELAAYRAASGLKEAQAPASQPPAADGQGSDADSEMIGEDDLKYYMKSSGLRS